MSDRLILIRGIPGSGKSTIAKNLFPSFIHVEADQYFIDKEGNYNWNKNEIKKAHEWCQLKVRDWLRRGADVVVTNTFVKKWELEAYLEIAKELSVEVTILIATGNYNNIHNVPAEIVERMKKFFEY